MAFKALQNMTVIECLAFLVMAQVDDIQKKRIKKNMLKTNYMKKNLRHYCSSAHIMWCGWLEGPLQDSEGLTLWLEI